MSTLPLPLVLRLASDLADNISPFYEDPRHGLLEILQYPRYMNRLGNVAQSREIATPHIGKDGFQVCMDVTQFKPSELNVKVVEDSIVVEGKHEEREDDHGYISRHFVRRYKVPKGYNPEKVASTLSSDGVLTISIPKPAAVEDKSKERHIQIQQTGPARLNVKENSDDKAKK